jgi:hypothetical protein
MWKALANGVEDTRQVDVEDLAPLCGVHLVDRTEAADPGIGEHDRQTA